MIFLGSDAILELIKNSPDEPNTKFLSASHNLWTRFHNYDHYPAMALVRDDKIVCVHFATFNKNLYTNSYEIVTMPGQERKGYAKALWEEYVEYAVIERGMKRLKNSCIATSVPWHVRNGLIFWAIDPTGSLKTDQPLYPSIEAQIRARTQFIKQPTLALPSPNTFTSLWKEQLQYYNFGAQKTKRVLDAIKSAGDNWLGDWLREFVE